MPLVLRDGYTLSGNTRSESGTAVGLPVINYRYRPALPEALAEWRYATQKAPSGKAVVEAAAKLVAGQLVSWDVEELPGKPAPVTIEFVKEIPEPILDQLVEAVTTWAPKAESAAGNSAGV